MTVDEFTDVLLSSPPESVVRQHLLSGVPFVFRNNPSADSRMHAHLARSLDVSDSDIRVVGSAQIGFSLNPDNYPRAFGDSSDIDVAVVSDRLFDVVWYSVLRWHYAVRTVGTDNKWARERRWDLYWGYVVPDRIRFDGLSLPALLTPIRDLSTRWFNTFRSLSTYDEFAQRDVTGRLYRTWDHAVLYHARGLSRVRELLTSSGLGG